ncbi:MAG TPA: PLP-dependent aminotransferase family protein, partial [Anaerolineales bacterium]|nr:PLP-dependent aminotransferase family protein [Anaerolineales bacterium]
PSYFLALRIFADHDLRVVPIRTDEAGLDMDELVHALGESSPKFIYIIPSFQNPSGHTLSPERRRQLIALAQQHGFLIVADEVYQFLGYTETPPPSFGTQIESGQVISLGSFSKILAPGLRLGWMHTHASIVQKAVACGLLDSAGGLNPFTSAIVRSLIERGDLEKNIVSLKSELGHRMRVMDEAIKTHLPQARYVSPRGGYFFWLQIPGIDAQELQQKAKEFQVGLRPGVRFSSRNELKDFMRLSISHYGAADIEEGVRRLRRCIES